MAMPKLDENAVAAVVARFLKRRGVDRIFALCGGHIMPIWMCADAEGIEIIDVRDERAAVYMAHAYGELTGNIGVALVTAGPGITNAMTGIANAHVSRAPVLVLAGRPPMPQSNRGGLQDLPHTEIARPITRYARTLSVPELVLQELDEAVSRALGHGGDPGPAFAEFPTDTLRAVLPTALQLPEHLDGRPWAAPTPTAAAIEQAVDVLWSAQRPLVISGRGVRDAAPPLTRLLDKLGAVYLDTGESKGLIADEHPGVVAAMRGAVMGQADVVLTVGRRLDFQLAFGSPAVFGDARFVRIADTPGELRDNRRGEVELFGSCAQTLQSIVDTAGNRIPSVDREWADGLREKHLQRAEKLKTSMAVAASDESGRIHPNRLLSELQAQMAADAVLIADGGDFLSFARIGLSAARYLDPGSLGCIGIGTPFGIAASLALPGRQVIVATGDGAFGFNAMEIDTAVRHKAPVLIVVANNGAWQIEVHDQTDNHGRVVGTRLQFADHAAMAKAFGMYAERVEQAEDLHQAIARAIKNLPALLDVVVSPEARSSDGKTGLAWVPDLQALEAWNDAERNWRDG